jgi:hypothetical protein
MRISDRWFLEDNFRSPVIECLLHEQIELPPGDLSGLFTFYDVNETWPHLSFEQDRHPRAALKYDDELPIFWLLDKHLKGDNGTGREEWILPRLQILVEHGVNFNVTCIRRSKTTTPLYIAMVNLRSCRLANIMIENGAEINWTPFECPIMCSLVLAQWQRPAMDVVRFGLSKGLCPNQWNEDGLTPLILAIKSNCMTAVCSLLNHGADPLLPSQPTDDIFEEYVYETSPLEMACGRGYHYCLLELLWHIDKRALRFTSKIERPLLLACAWGGLNCVQPLLEAHMTGRWLDHDSFFGTHYYYRNPNERRDGDLETNNLLVRALFIACNNSRNDIIMYLVKWIKADNMHYL